MDRFLDFQYNMAMEELSYYGSGNYDSAMEGNIGDAIMKLWSAVSGAVVKAALFIAKMFRELAGNIKTAIKSIPNRIAYKVDTTISNAADKYERSHAWDLEVHPEVKAILDNSIKQMNDIIAKMETLPTLKNFSDELGFDKWDPESQRYDGFDQCKDRFNDISTDICNECGSITDQCQGKYSRGEALKDDPHFKFVSVGLVKMAEDLDDIAKKWEKYSKTYDNAYKLYANRDNANSIEDDFVRSQMRHVAEGYQKVCTCCTNASSTMSGFFNNNLYLRIAKVQKGENAQMSKDYRHMKIHKFTGPIG
jgi:hypothetical protein